MNGAPQTDAPQTLAPRTVAVVTLAPWHSLYYTSYLGFPKIKN